MSRPGRAPACPSACLIAWEAISGTKQSSELSALLMNSAGREEPFAGHTRNVRSDLHRPVCRGGRRRVLGRSESEVEPDRVFQGRHLARAQQATASVQPWFIDRMQVCAIDVTDVIASQAGVAVDGYMGAAGSFVARDQGYRDRTQARAEGVDGQHHHAMVANAGEVGFPDLAP
jgi:hypothetical protein